MNPTIGRTVRYKTTEADRKLMEDKPNCNVQNELPAVIVAVWSEECVNLKVQLDGEGELWVTSSLRGDQEMQWDWFVKN